MPRPKCLGGAQVPVLLLAYWVIISVLSMASESFYFFFASSAEILYLLYHKKVFIIDHV